VDTPPTLRPQELPMTELSMPDAPLALRPQELSMMEPSLVDAPPRIMQEYTSPAVRSICATHWAYLFGPVQNILRVYFAYMQNKVIHRSSVQLSIHSISSVQQVVFRQELCIFQIIFFYFSLELNDVGSIIHHLRSYARALKPK
jgi:hypothetical protein